MQCFGEIKQQQQGDSLTLSIGVHAIKLKVESRKELEHFDWILIEEGGGGKYKRKVVNEMK